MSLFFTIVLAMLFVSFLPIIFVVALYIIGGVVYFAAVVLYYLIEAIKYMIPVIKDLPETTKEWYRWYMGKA